MRTRDEILFDINDELERKTELVILTRMVDEKIIELEKEFVGNLFQQQLRLNTEPKTDKPERFGGTLQQQLLKLLRAPRTIKELYDEMPTFKQPSIRGCLSSSYRNKLIQKTGKHGSKQYLITKKGLKKFAAVAEKTGKKKV